MAQLRDPTAILWLGMYQIGSDWVWTDNSHVSYTNWASGEPSNVRKTLLTFLRLNIHALLLILPLSYEGFELLSRKCTAVQLHYAYSMNDNKNEMLCCNEAPCSPCSSSM